MALDVPANGTLLEFLVTMPFAFIILVSVGAVVALSLFLACYVWVLHRCCKIFYYPPRTSDQFELGLPVVGGKANIM